MARSVTDPRERDDEAPYDPELRPFLSELEHRVRERAERAQGRRPPVDRADSSRSGADAAAEHGRPRARRNPLRPSRRRRGDPPALRISRRVAIVVTLLCLGGGGALAAEAVFTGAQNPAQITQGAQIAVARGTAGADRWRFDLYERSGQLCQALYVSGQAVSSSCASPPGAHGLAANSLVSATRRYVFGVTGAGVATVAVRLGEVSEQIGTRAVDGAEALAGGLQTGSRFFALVVARPSGSADPPAVVTGFNAAHRRVAGPVASCPQGAALPGCEAGG